MLFIPSSVSKVLKILQVGQGRLTLTRTAKITKTEVRAINKPGGVADKFAGGDLYAVKNIFFNREERNRLEVCCLKLRRVTQFGMNGAFYFEWIKISL